MVRARSSPRDRAHHTFASNRRRPRRTATAPKQIKEIVPGSGTDVRLEVSISLTKLLGSTITSTVLAPANAFTVKVDVESPVTGPTPGIVSAHGPVIAV